MLFISCSAVLMVHFIDKVTKIRCVTHMEFLCLFSDLEVANFCRESIIKLNLELR